MTTQEAFDEHHRAVFRFALRLTRQAHTAEDIVQQCFLAHVHAPERFDPAKGAARTYFLAIARNLVLKHYRDHRAEQQLEAAPLDAADPRLALEVSAAVERAVAALPLLEQEALVLFQYEGLTLAEIARVTGAEVGTIKARLRRARERLRVSLVAYRRVGECNGMQ